MRTAMACFSFGAVSPVSIIWALVGLIVWLMARLSLRDRHVQGSFPPGPRPWPIIGNLNLIGRLPHVSLHKLSETYGPLMQLKFGSFNVVVTNSADLAKEFLKTHDSKFASRPPLAAGKYFAYNFADVVWGNGPIWRQGRKIFLTQLFNSKRLESYEYVRVQARGDLLSQLYGLRGNQVRIRDHLSHLNLSIMSRIVLGKKDFSVPEHLNKESAVESAVTLGELQEMFDELFRLNSVFVTGDLFPWLGWLELGVKKMKRLSRKFDELLDFSIKEHKIARNGQQKEPAKDMMDILLDLADDPKLEVKLTIDNVKGFIMDLLAGSTNTSVTPVEWAMAELIKNPEKMKKATEELDRVIGQGRWVEEDDIPNLPYIDAVTKETMRLHPVSALLPPHQALEDCQIKHYHIPKATILLINLWSTGRDPILWDCPQEFRPERFLDNAVDVKGMSFELLPFGSGRRMCPGLPLGLKMIQSSLANLIHGFNWTLRQEMKPQDLDMEEMHGVTTHRKHPLVAALEPRLPPYLYTSSSWKP